MPRRGPVREYFEHLQNENVAHGVRTNSPTRYEGRKLKFSAFLFLIINYLGGLNYTIGLSVSSNISNIENAIISVIFLR